MGVFFATLKGFVFTFNLICLLLGIGVITVSSLGLEVARPDTEEHTYYIVGIILGALVCMTTFFGCYGVICELLGVNIIYALFLLMLLGVQYLQMQSYVPHAFYRGATQRLEHAWRELEMQPRLMQALEMDFQCCGLYSSSDYNYRHLTTPSSCYPHRNKSDATNLFKRGCMEAIETSYHSAVRRERIFTLALMIAESLVFIYSIVLSVLLYKQDRSNQMGMEAVRGYMERPAGNHIGSRTHLLSH